MRIIGLAMGDLHLHNWKQYNKDGKRLKQNLAILEDFITLSHNLSVPIYFTGDLFHKPEGMENYLFDQVTKSLRKLFVKYNKAKLYGISGNHDQAQDNFVDSQSPSYVKSISRLVPHFKCIDFKSINLGEVTIHGIPYLTHNIGFEDAMNNFELRDGKNILLIHTNLYGAKDPSGYEIGNIDNIPRNLGKFFSRFDLVLSGHIHKGLEIWPNKVVMVGAPNQQRKSDMGCTMGYYEVYDNLTYKFIPTNYPEFKEYEEGEEIDDYHYWVKKPKIINNKKNVKEFSNLLNRVDLANRYCDIKGIDNPKKRKVLISLLNTIE